MARCTGGPLLGLLCAVALLQLAQAAVHPYMNEYFYSVGDAFIFRGGREGMWESKSEVGTLHPFARSFCFHQDSPLVYVVFATMQALIDGPVWPLQTVKILQEYCKMLVRNTGLRPLLVPSLRLTPPSGTLPQ
eukprot:1039504-Prorocentrum_minimum.AAC.4